MNNKDYSEDDFQKEIAGHENRLIKEYEDKARDKDYFNSYFIDTVLQPKKNQIGTNEKTFDFLNTFPNKSRVTKFTRLELLKQYCLDKALDIREVASLIAHYDALVRVGHYVYTQGYFAINTRRVYQELYIKWRDEGLEFSKDYYKRVQEAIEQIFYVNKVQSFIDWSEDAGFVDYIFKRYPSEVKNSKKTDNFPIPRFIVFHKNVGAQDPDMIMGREGDNVDEVDFNHLLATYRILFLSEDTYF